MGSSWVWISQVFQSEAVFLGSWPGVGGLFAEARYLSQVMGQEQVISGVGAEVGALLRPPLGERWQFSTQGLGEQSS